MDKIIKTIKDNLRVLKKEGYEKFNYKLILVERINGKVELTQIYSKHISCIKLIKGYIQADIVIKDDNQNPLILISTKNEKITSIANIKGFKGGLY